jgi:hypothetical protein
VSADRPSSPGPWSLAPPCRGDEAEPPSRPADTTGEEFADADDADPFIQQLRLALRTRLTAGSERLEHHAYLSLRTRILTEAASSVAMAEHHRSRSRADVHAVRVRGRARTSPRPRLPLRIRVRLRVRLRLPIRIRIRWLHPPTRTVGRRSRNGSKA